MIVVIRLVVFLPFYQTKIKLPGKLKGYVELLPNPLLLLSPAIIKESLASSEIENIHTTLEDVLQ